LEARKRRDAARQLLESNRDPAFERKMKELMGEDAGNNTFELIGREWLKKFSVKWSPSHLKKNTAMLEKNIFPWLGPKAIKEVIPLELLACLSRIEKRGALETAHRTSQCCGQIFRYAVATGRADHDITLNLRGSLPSAEKTHLASITEPKGVGELLRSINDYKGEFITRCALRLAPLVFVRPGELRQAEWKEFEQEQAEWRIAAKRMKKKIQHIVPLSKQALAILAELHPLTGKGRYVFPGVRSNEKSMSENTVNSALRLLGYDSEQMTGHGFRSMASTLLNENGWNGDAIERQLAHGERNAVRAAYNYAEFLPERRLMMQWWSDYLESLVAGTEKPVKPRLDA
jgi:integrase